MTVDTDKNFNRPRVPVLVRVAGLMVSPSLRPVGRAPTDPAGSRPDEASITWRVGAMLLEQNDEWQLQRRYMSLEELRTLSDSQPARLSAVVS